LPAGPIPATRLLLRTRDGPGAGHSANGAPASVNDAWKPVKGTPTQQNGREVVDSAPGWIREVQLDELAGSDADVLAEEVGPPSPFT
jgi:hypothetical protein